MFGAFLKKPVNQCYVIKRPFSESMFTIERNGKRAVVAFRGKDQAHTMKRLMFEMEIKDPKKKKTVVVERMEVEFLARSCGVTGLDVILYYGDTSFLVYNACDQDCDDLRFEFENRYKYGKNI